jgi:antirestriction protein ArdC
MHKYLWGESMVDEIVHLLSERNRYLSQFAAIGNIQIQRLKNKNFEQLNEFYMTREHILGVVSKIEAIVNQKLEDKSIVFTSEQKRKINEVLGEKDALIKGILGQDLDILSSIEQEKSSIILELKVLQKGRKTVSAYKSGNDLNKKLDEEA